MTPTFISIKPKYLILLYLVLLSCRVKTESYVCPPCGLECDTLSFSKPGLCPHCKMKLVTLESLEADSRLVVNSIDIKEGSGRFLVEGGHKKDKTIMVHYHRPKEFSNRSKVLMVLPGAGRNGGDYRDAWKEASEEYDILVLALEYPEKYYPDFWSYNLAGMIYDVDITSRQFQINPDPQQWVFGDFDRIFEAVRKALGLNADGYDMFGHSAGGQLLHRYAIFRPENRADRMLAANSGWYTIPTKTDDFPTGLKNMAESMNTVDFSSNLVVFLGQKDDASETRGELNRSPELDKQGKHRLARGLYFFDASKKIAAEQQAEFNWALEIVPNVGHDYVEMSKQAAKYLYRDEQR